MKQNINLGGIYLGPKLFEVRVALIILALSKCLFEGVKGVMSPSPNGPYHRDFLPGRETVLIEQVPEELFTSSCLNLEKTLRDESFSSQVSQRRSFCQLTHAKHSSHVIASNLSMWCINAISTQLFGQSKLRTRVLRRHSNLSAPAPL